MRSQITAVYLINAVCTSQLLCQTLAFLHFLASLLQPHLVWSISDAVLRLSVQTFSAVIGRVLNWTVVHGARPPMMLAAAFPHRGCVAGGLHLEALAAMFLRCALIFVSCWPWCSLFISLPCRPSVYSLRVQHLGWNPLMYCFCLYISSRIQQMNTWNITCTFDIEHVNETPWAGFKN